MIKFKNFIKQQKYSLGIILAVIVAGSVTANIVLAAVPNARGRIGACYNKITYSLKVSNTGTCSATENSISWNQRGNLVSNLTNANFDGASMAYWDLSGLNFSNSSFQSSILNGSDLTGSNLSNTVIAFGPLRKAILDNANLSGAQFGNGVDFTGAHFIGATITNAQVNGNNSAVNADFTNANFTGSVFTSFSANNTNFSGTNFKDADLSQAGTSLGNSTMTGAIWNNTTCPDATNSNTNGGTCIGHLN